MQAGIEPLRTVRHAGLVQNRIHQFIIKNLCIIFCSEVTIPFAPNPPAVCHAVGHLLYSGFPSGGAVGLWHTSFSKIFLCKDVGGYLAPLPGHFHIIHLKYHFSTRVFNYGGTVIVFKHIVRRYAILGKLPGKLQSFRSLIFLRHKYYRLVSRLRNH